MASLTILIQSVGSPSIAADPAVGARPLPPGPPPPGASSCSGCHGGIPPLPVLAGRDPADLITAMDAFRAGSREATVMDRIMRGFTKPESDAIAAWWAARP